MPPLEDPDLLNCFKAILSNWCVTDYVTAKDEALEWAGKNLAGFSLKSLAKLMNDHVRAGGEIDQVRETGPNGTIGRFTTISGCRGKAGRSISKPFSWMTIPRIPTSAL